MKKQFWNVWIAIYAYGEVKANVIRSRLAKVQPKDSYEQKPGMEAYSLWFATELEARDAVAEALAMNDKQGAAA